MFLLGARNKLHLHRAGITGEIRYEIILIVEELIRIRSENLLLSQDRLS